MSIRLLTTRSTLPVCLTSSSINSLHSCSACQYFNPKYISPLTFTNGTTRRIGDLIADVSKILLIREGGWSQEEMLAGDPLLPHLMPEAIALSPYVESAHCLAGICVLVRK